MSIVYDSKKVRFISELRLLLLMRKKTFRITKSKIKLKCGKENAIV